MLDVAERDRCLGVWENEGGPAAIAKPMALQAGLPYRAPRNGIPRFLNDAGSGVVEISVRALNCIGATPPADHPHVYLEMGQRPSILCPYCATRFQFDRTLHYDETRPAGCFHDDGGRPHSGEIYMSATPAIPNVAPSPAEVA